MTCKTHPDAPHGFVRGASHSEDRYVCECEFWEEPKMNERINELAEKACAVTRNTFGKPMNLDELEKFAELIVRRMLDITDAHTEVFQTDRDWALIEHIKQSVKTHFGVEE